MRGRRRGSSGTAADFLKCFPPRTHLALMPPKTVCSPSRPSASSERRHSTSARPSSSGAHLRAVEASRSRRLAAVDVGLDNEPSSPKVGCAGQIKVSRSAKPKGAGGKAPKKATTWIRALGIKKDALPFLNAFQGAFRLNVSGCFGRFPGAVVEYTSGEDDEEEEEQVELEGKGTEHDDALAKWFMVLEEGKRVPRKKQQEQEQPQDEEEDAAPPANALMLMRCRSAPAKGLARRLGGGGGGDAGEGEEAKSAKKAGEEEEEVEKENLVVMRYPPDFFQVSVDIAKETWIVGGDDSILRCRSWKK
uniref:Uncharacterized protein n=1 Tax=Avena sativa TaxID=4498 RepID=A0ACD5YR32_AVESA